MFKPDAQGLYHLKHPNKVKGEDLVVIVRRPLAEILLRVGYTPYEEDPAIPPGDSIQQSEGDCHENHED